EPLLKFLDENFSLEMINGRHDPKTNSPVILEPTGPQVEASLFRPDNVYVEVSKSGKHTSDHFKIWLKNVFFPNLESKSLLLIDSWTGHCPDAVKSVKPSDKEVEVMIILKGTTGNIQPLDVFGFRVWKNF
ncbi:hypothetical protein PV328_012202, partial [Microctonus aethiopoides]